MEPGILAQRYKLEKAFGQLHYFASDPLSLWNRGPCGKAFFGKKAESIRVFLFTLAWPESRQFCRVDV